MDYLFRSFVLLLSSRKVERIRFFMSEVMRSFHVPLLHCVPATISRSTLFIFVPPLRRTLPLLDRSR